MAEDPNAATDPQSGLSRRNLLMGGAMAAVAGIAYAREPKANTKPLKKGAFETLIPMTIGKWEFKTSSGLVLPPPDALSDRLYDEMLTRVYVAPNAPPVMFLIAYSGTQDGLLQVHRPEVCYPVGGYALSRTVNLELPLTASYKLPIRMFSATSAARNEQVLYWTRIGTDVPESWAQQRMAVIKANLKGIIPDGILVRASVMAPDADEARPYLEMFVKQMIGSLNPQARNLLIGGA